MNKVTLKEGQSKVTMMWHESVTRIAMLIWRNSNWAKVADSAFGSHRMNETELGVMGYFCGI